MEATAQFPVYQGAVVHVTCSYSDAVNDGDSEVTCKTETDFTFSKEPSCSIPGLFIFIFITKHLLWFLFKWTQRLIS